MDAVKMKEHPPKLVSKFVKIMEANKYKFLFTCIYLNLFQLILSRFFLFA
jgi:hypothetical protein